MVSDSSSSSGTDKGRREFHGFDGGRMASSPGAPPVDGSNGSGSDNDDEDHHGSGEDAPVVDLGGELDNGGNAGGQTVKRKRKAKSGSHSQQQH